MKVNAAVAFGLISIALYLTRGDTTQITFNASPSNCDNLQPGNKGFLQLTNRSEPGEAVIVFGKVLDANTNVSLKNVAIDLYHTDQRGIYSISGREEDARIKGTVQTDENGCFKISTILPGDYPNQKNSRHIHYTISAAGYANKRSVLFFKGFITDNISSGGALTVLDIKRNAAGTWIGSINFTLHRIPK